VGEQVIQRIVQVVAHEVSPPFAGDADIPSSDAVRSSNHSRGVSRARDATSQVVVSEHEISELGLDSGTMDAELLAGLDNSSNIENIPIQSPQGAQRAPERYGELDETITCPYRSQVCHAYTHQIEPRTYQETIQSPDVSRWRAAMDDEYKSLLVNFTWELVPLPPEQKIVKSKWVFKIKTKMDGTSE
jgi:hypothetical protein